MRNRMPPRVGPTSPDKLSTDSMMPYSPPTCDSSDSNSDDDDSVGNDSHDVDDDDDDDDT